MSVGAAGFLQRYEALVGRLPGTLRCGPQRLLRFVVPDCPVEHSTAEERLGSSPACDQSRKLIFKRIKRRGTRPKLFWQICNC